ncbi:MAG TPA: carboxymuconolactone decarboxylase family protein [Myxococcota bacterium]|nr:carboxymuconolactone decarboxylase family protein [Myxococcota bacterium]
MRLTRPRIEPLDAASAPPETRDQLAKLAGGDVAGGRVLNIFSTLAHHPELMRRWLVFGNHVLAKSTLPARERELAILRVGYLCKSEYEWGQHVLIARRCGISDEEIARIAVGPDARGWSSADAAILRAADELHADQMIGDGTWAELEKKWSVQQRMDLVFAIGQYHLVAMALNTFGVQRDPGVPGLP